jgi:hypothetical protein
MMQIQNTGHRSLTPCQRILLDPSEAARLEASRQNAGLLLA